MQTNLDGAMSMTKAVLPPMMKQRRGAIVNVASLCGLHGVVGQTNYSAAKGALIAMTRSLAREVARSGIRVNCVAPGLVDTDMIATLDAEVKKEMIRADPDAARGEAGRSRGGDRVPARATTPAESRGR